MIARTYSCIHEDEHLHLLQHNVSTSHESVAMPTNEMQSISASGNPNVSTQNFPCQSPNLPHSFSPNIVLIAITVYYITAIIKLQFTIKGYSITTPIE